MKKFVIFTICIFSSCIFMIFSCDAIDREWNKEKYKKEKREKEKREKEKLEKIEKENKKISYSILRTMSNVEDFLRYYDSNENKNLVYICREDDSLIEKEYHTDQGYDYTFHKYYDYEDIYGDNEPDFLKSSAIDTLYNFLDDLVIRELSGKLKTETRETLKNRYLSIIAKLQHLKSEYKN